ncbi:hypothetical protein EJ04DRAFT_513086 [Polyplosphaeria fusca]|uniref:Uncharacterized protein n=1 Tax=Polyplosphaeria fusca TaxID=682080 RepID=A0A9P4QYJ9_9PLEO|nr:hypothetical protein EJ04DRAFT_513086 [Polyplosphaeria fusca]
MSKAVPLGLGQVTYPLDVAHQAALIGGAAAVPGAIQGAFFGTLRTSTPIIFSLISGAQWFAIGSTWYAARTALLQRDGLLNWWNQTRGAPLIARTDSNPSPQDRLRASALSGTFTGVSLGLLFRGPRNVIPGAIMFTLFGWGGQTAYNYLDKENTDAVVSQARPKSEEEKRLENENWMQRAAKSKWIPMKALTDDEYVQMLNEKLLALNAEIAIVDDRIEKFKSEQRAFKKDAAQHDSVAQSK